MNTLAHGIVKRSQEEALLSTVIPNRRPFSAELDSRARALTSLLLVGFLTLASAVTLRAQQITGTLYGSVLDSQNAAIPGATVTATNVDTGLARVLTFDPDVGLDRLLLTPISQSAADQRAGRAHAARGECRGVSEVARSAWNHPGILR